MISDWIFDAPSGVYISQEYKQRLIVEARASGLSAPPVVTPVAYYGKFAAIDTEIAQFDPVRGIQLHKILVTSMLCALKAGPEDDITMRATMPANFGRVKMATVFSPAVDVLGLFGPTVNWAPTLSEETPDEDEEEGELSDVDAIMALVEVQHCTSAQEKYERLVKRGIRFVRRES